MSIYCTYITFYRGNKLPPFYIGSTSVEKVNNGYRGSVLSKEYKAIWKKELKENPNLFKTTIISKYFDRKEAAEKELKLQIATDAQNNPLYINKGFASKNFMCKAHSKETRIKMAAAAKGIPKSATHRASISKSKTGLSTAPHSKESRVKAAEKQKGQKRSVKTRKLMSDIARKFFYVSPIGIIDIPNGFDAIIPSDTMQKWCSNPNKIISKQSYAQSRYLHENYSNKIIGKSYGELGFYRINKESFCLI